MSSHEHSLTATIEEDPSGCVSLRSDAKALPIPSGLYQFTVRSAAPSTVPAVGNLQFPALHIAPGPGSPANVIDFVGNHKSNDGWLYKTGDRLVVKVEEPGTTLILSSIRADGTQALDVKLERLNADDTAGFVRPVVECVPGTVQTIPDITTAGPSTTQRENLTLDLQLGLHIRNRGDLVFAGSGWAGLLAENLWIEAFSILVLETINSGDIEYKGLSANGFESPWLSDGASCGTKGCSTPLIGFAIRPKPDIAAAYDCEYSGYFQSGATVGPYRNGTPCRPKTSGDPLVGIQLRISPRAATATPIGAEHSSAAKSSSTAKGPRFSKFRENGVSAQSAKAGKDGQLTQKARAPSKKRR